MEIVETKKDLYPVLRLKGRFDAHEVEPVRVWMQEQVVREKTRIIIDLADVHFIDSTALSTLVRGLKHCREQQGDLHLCNLQQPVRVIFELTRLDKAFDIFSTEEEAAKAF